MFDIFRKPLEVLRAVEGSYVGGYRQEVEITCFTIYASVQGTDAEVLQIMPEGARISASYTLRTTTKLLTSVIGASTPDIVIIDGDKYVVERVTKWQNLPHTKHYEIVVVRENIDAD